MPQASTPGLPQQPGHSPYGSPGGADTLGDSVLLAWNQTVLDAYKDGLSDFGTEPERERAGRYVSSGSLVGREVPVTWLPVPRQAVACLGRSRARALCDMDGVTLSGAGSQAPTTLAGGREWHNEYCEYRVLRREDDNGNQRPKRVEITTELREYWLCLATEDPDYTLDLAREVLEDPKLTSADLYGCGDPKGLPPKERGEAFIEVTAGSAVKAETGRLAPSGPCNRERALFMCHPINGLDDLYFILLFGAQPYTRLSGGRTLPVPLMWIFLDNPWFRDSPETLMQLRDTYCRNADPAATTVAYGAAFIGAEIALADPPGVYMRRQDFDSAALRLRSTGEPIEQRGWIRWRRPDDGTRHQRLEVGPRDDDPEFLDDIDVSRGANPVPLTGGFQLLELLSVGPQVTVKPASAPPRAEDYQPLQGSAADIRCGSGASEVCRQLADWAKAADAAQTARSPHWKHRLMGRRPIGDGDR